MQEWPADDGKEQQQRAEIERERAGAGAPLRSGLDR
jgi:hypothetical protein